MATSDKMVRQQSPSSSTGSSPEQNSMRGAVHDQQQSLHILVDPQPDGHTNMIHLINPTTGQILSSFIAEHGVHIEIQPGFVFRVPFPQEHGYPSYPPHQFPPQPHYQQTMMPQTMNQMNLLAPPFNPRCPVHGSPTHQNSSLGFQNTPSSGDDRLDRRREKLQRRLREKQGGQKSTQCNCMRLNGNYHAYQHGFSPSSSQGVNGKGSKHYQSSKMNGPKTETLIAGTAEDLDGDEAEVGEDGDIATLMPPKATVIDAYSVKVSWVDCIANNSHLSSCQFELEMASSSSEFNTIHVGTESEYTVTCLTPATEYSFRICALLHGKKGNHSDAVTVETPATVPETPSLPRVIQKTKTSLTLKWSAPGDGGSPITTYRLYWNEGKPNGDFCELYAGLQRQYKLSHKLPPGVLCQFKVQASNSLGSSKFSTVLKCFTSAGPPDAPSPPKLAESGTTMLSLYWDEPATNGAPIIEYELEMNDERKGYGFLPAYCGEQAHHTAKDLLRNMQYKFRVRARNAQGRGNYSPVSTFSTLPEPPGKMEKPKPQGKVKTTAFTVSWDTPKDTGGTSVTGYCLEMDDGQGGSFKEVYNGTDMEYTAEGLSPGFTYKLRVMAIGDGGRGPWSSAALITTQPVCPGVPKGPRLSKMKPEPTALHLEWDPPSYEGGAPVSHYFLRMSRSESTEYQSVYEGPRRSCDICGLNPGESYWFTLQAQNRAGLSPITEPVELLTAPGPPDACQVTDISSKSPFVVRLEWKEPTTHGTPVTSYCVEQLEDGVFSRVFEGPTMFCELKKNINPATEYYFRVQAVSLAGTGPFSDIVAIQTPPAPPATVSFIKVTDQSSDAAMIQWKHPSNNGAPITEYRIEVSGASNHFITVPVPTGVSEEGEKEDEEEDISHFDDEDVDSDFEDQSDVDSVSADVMKEEKAVKNPDYMEHEIAGLQADSAYRLRIQAVNKVGSSPQSHSLQFMTKELPPAAPSLDLISASHHSLKLKWGDLTASKRGHIGTSYTLQMRNKNGLFTNVYSGMSQSSSVTKLKELTPYTFRIRAKNDAGEGEFSDPKCFCTRAQPPSAVKELKVKDVTSTTVTLSWSVGDLIRNDDQMSYILQMLHHDSMRDFVEVYHGSKHQFQVTALQPDQEFQFRACAVRALSEASLSLVAQSQSEIKGPFSSVVRVRTFGETRPDVSVEDKTLEKEKEIASGMELSDSQIALVILGSFLVLCLLVALGLKLSLTGF